MSLQEKQVFDFIKKGGPMPPLAVEAETTTGIVFSNNNTKILEVRNQLQQGIQLSIFDTFKFLDLTTITAYQKKELAEAFGLDVKNVSASIASHLRNQKVMAELDTVPENEYEFVDTLMKKWDTKMSYQAIFDITAPYVYAGNEYSMADFAELPKEVQESIKLADTKTFTFDTMWKRLIKQSATLKLGYNERALMRALEDWRDRERGMIKQMIGDSIRFNPNNVEAGKAEWDKYINLLTEKEVEESKEVLRHFVWQIKRKFFGKPVTDHMMPVLTGKQGIGKSTVIKNLNKVLSEFVAPTNFKAIVDDRYHDIWNNYILVFDEMGYGSSTEIDLVKNKITSDHFTSRILGINGGTQIINNATFIGSSNKDLSRLIFDETGMRRFFQIECADKLDWDALGEINIELLWTSIDETSDSDLTKNEAVISSIKKSQDSKRSMSLIEMFLRERQYVNRGGIEKIKGLQFYAEFQEYEKAHQPLNTMTNRKFALDVMDISKHVEGLEIQKLDKNTGVQYQIRMVEKGE
ncbi:VapE domain-containing protein [Sapientia aquatica]|nr:VapE domain-containing protein [Sapientia aquatica]